MNRMCRMRLNIDETTHRVGHHSYESRLLRTISDCYRSYTLIYSPASRKPNCIISGVYTLSCIDLDTGDSTYLYNCNNTFFFSLSTPIELEFNALMQLLPTSSRRCIGGFLLPINGTGRQPSLCLSQSHILFPVVIHLSGLSDSMSNALLILCLPQTKQEPMPFAKTHKHL